MRTLRNVHLWAIVLIFVGCCILHYAEQIGLLATVSPSAHFGLTRHALERILFVGPVVYAAYVFGLRAGLIACAAALAAMLPRAIFISPVPADALVETFGMVVIGVLSTLGLWRLAKEREKGQVYLVELESAHKVLQHYVQSARSSEKRLTILNAISAVLGESLEPERVLRKATQMVSELMEVEVALIYTLDEEAQELTLVAYEGVSDEFASVVGRVGVGEGIYGEVAKTGQAMIVEDASRDPRMSQPEVAKMRIHIQLIVPLVLKDRVRGTLCVAMRRPREFTQEDIELLTAVGTQIATAIENAFLYDRERVVAQRLAASERNLRRLFENASDAIWVHDLSGDIAIANQAAAELTGYPVDELVRMNVKAFLLEDGLTVAGQIRRSLLEKEPVQQPYEQRLVRKDGSEAILSIATGLVVEDDRPTGFQHIARDVTERRKAERLLRESERQLSQIVDGSTVPIFVVNKMHLVTHWNRACENLTGVAASDVVGILGRTGSGKTTITRLLCRLYDPLRGDVRLGDVSLPRVPLDDLRQRVGIVTQDVQLFQASVRDNLTFFDESIGDETILDVIHELGLGAWLQSLPEGLDTQLMNNTGGLSAGEAQLLAFTRVFLRDPGLVILDEASSRLDPLTEQLIERAIDRLFRDRTAIIVAHRLATVQRADKIMILEDGRIIEFGDREQLASDPDSRFARLLRAGIEEVLV